MAHRIRRQWICSSSAAMVEVPMVEAAMDEELRQGEMFALKSVAVPLGSKYYS